MISRSVRCAPTRTRLAAAVALSCAAASLHAVTITVDNAGDSTSSAPCTLRNAITAINYGNAVLFAGCRNSMNGLFGDNDTVRFAPALANSTITLQQGQISNYAPLSVLGSGQIIDAANASRVMYTIAYLRLSHLTLRNGNAGAAPGGGLYSSQAFVALDNIVVSANHSASSGGGLAIRNGSANLVNATLTGNSSSGGHGGAGLFATASGVALTNSTVADNDATCSDYCGGGIAAISASALTITAATIARNTATGTGSSIAGGLYASDSKTTVINSTIAGNTASGSDAIAGAILENHASSVATRGITMTNATVSSNHADAAAPTAAASGGVLGGTKSSAHVVLANTILAGNGASSAGNVATAADLLINNGSASADHALLGSALLATYAGNGNVFSDAPALAPLGTQGGSTATMALLAGSPGIDAGSNALAVDGASQPLVTDQRGAQRIVDGRVDIGAYEFPGDHIFSDTFGP
jgi:hypothetical protein